MLLNELIVLAKEKYANCMRIRRFHLHYLPSFKDFYRSIRGSFINTLPYLVLRQYAFTLEPFLVLNFLTISAQSSYTSSNYAAVGDTFYMTNVNDFTLDFESTGTNFNWNFI